METNNQITILEKMSVILKKVLIKIIENKIEHNDEEFWKDLSQANLEILSFLHYSNEIMGTRDLDNSSIKLLLETWHSLSKEQDNDFSKALSGIAKGMFEIFMSSDCDPYSLDVVIEDTNDKDSGVNKNA